MEPYLGENRIFTINNLKRYWLPCDGRLLNVRENQALFTVIGNAYGGDGKDTFALPNLQGVVPIHFNSSDKGPNPSTKCGSGGGTETVALDALQLPSHSHELSVSDHSEAKKNPAIGNQPAQDSPHLSYTASSNPVAIAPNVVRTPDGGQPHTNVQPYTVVNYCIAISGIYPFHE